MSLRNNLKFKYKKHSINLDPRTKLIMLLILSILTFMIDELYLLLFLFDILIVLSIISNIDFLKILKYLKPILWSLPVIFLIQLIFLQDTMGNEISIPVDFGVLNIIKLNQLIIKVKIDSIELAINTCLRIMNLAFGSCLFSLSTNINDYLTSLIKIKIPFELAFMVGLVIYFLPMVIFETTEMQYALETRGVSVNRGSIRLRIKSFIILITAILMNFIEKSKYQAIAMDTRGFRVSKKRTHYRKIKLNFVDYFISLLTIAVFAIFCYIFRDQIKTYFELLV